MKKPSLLILGHGSSKHPHSSASVRMHAEVLQERELYDEVHVGFLKEKPNVEHLVEILNFENLIIVPDFLAQGYFTMQVLPTLLRLDTKPDSVRYCSPVGTHPAIQNLIYTSANCELGDWSQEEVSLMLVGHGSTKNPRSKESLLEHIRELKKMRSYAQISDLWLEEPPFVKNWEEEATQKKIILLPFLLNDGQHGGWDIPEMLGLDKDKPVHGVTHEVNGYEIRVAPALGTSPKFADVIESMAKAC